jgi:hypothetical protein
MLLTAAAVVVGAGIILFDPILQIGDLVDSRRSGLNVLSRMAVPVLYCMSERGGK